MARTFQLTRSVECPLNSRHAHYAGAAVILDGLNFVSRKLERRQA